MFQLQLLPLAVAVEFDGLELKLGIVQPRDHLTGGYGIAGFNRFQQRAGDRAQQHAAWPAAQRRGQAGQRGRVQREAAERGFPPATPDREFRLALPA